MSISVAHYVLWKSKQLTVLLFQGIEEKHFCATKIHHPNTACPPLLCKTTLLQAVLELLVPSTLFQLLI